MKKSEMEKAIAATLEILDASKEPLSYEYKADFLLTAIISFGMLPPRWIPEDHGYTYSDEPSGEPNGFKVSVFKWEPEND